MRASGADAPPLRLGEEFILKGCTACCAHFHTSKIQQNQQWLRPICESLPQNSTLVYERESNHADSQPIISLSPKVGGASHIRVRQMKISQYPDDAVKSRLSQKRFRQARIDRDHLSCRQAEFGGSGEVGGFRYF